MNILVIAAHPDDETLGCGGAIIKHIKNGDRVSICILTDGSGMRYTDKMTKTLKDNALKCATRLGVSNVIFKDLPNQMLDSIPITDVIKAIEDAMKRTKPDIVYTHDKGDLNHDHRVVYEATIVATRPIPGMKVKKLLTYFVPSSSEYNDVDAESIFVPNFFLNIKGEIGKKVKALSAYSSETRPYPHPRSSKAIRLYAERWGVQVGIEYAEPFRVIREVAK